MQYRTYNDLSGVIRANIGRFQGHGYDLIVGIPRSGMIPAYMIGLFLNVNVCTFAQFRDDTVLELPGQRPLSVDVTSPWQARRVLVVDDSYNTGTRLHELMDSLPSELRDRCDVWVIYSAREDVDVDYLEVVELPREFEWNIFHQATHLATTAFDMDGVLCRDPTEEENDDGPRYREFIRTATPLFLPSCPIGGIITSRLERYRPLTEAWLRDHGVDYGRLIMLNMDSAEERRQKQVHGSFKAEELVRGGFNYFIESDEHQAREINRLSGKPVYCVATNCLVDEPASEPISPVTPIAAPVPSQRRIRDVIARIPVLGPAIQRVWHRLKNVTAS